MRKLHTVTVLVKGGGDLGSGVAFRLFRAGFSVAITEVAQPTVIRRTVSFAEAIYEGEAVVEGVAAQRIDSSCQIIETVRAGRVPILVDPEALIVQEIGPGAVVDAIMAKRNLGTRITDAPAVIALGPGFTAGVDCHAVIETARGHNLGRVLLSGAAEPDTGIPGPIAGYTTERLVRAPASGVIVKTTAIGEKVTLGETIGWVGDTPVLTPLGGVLRGMIREGLQVRQGMKIGDVDPRGIRDYCFTISDKALAVAGGVLEAVLMLLKQRALK